MVLTATCRLCYIFKMKYILLLLFACLSLGFDSAHQLEKEYNTAADLTDFKKIVIQDEGMTCAMCAQGIEKKLYETKAIKFIEVDFETKLISIYYPKHKHVSDKVINDAIYYAGYKLVTIDRLN